MSFTDGTQTNSEAVALADGGFLIAWQTYDRNQAADGILAQRYDSFGRRVGAEFHLDAARSLSEVDLAARSDGGFVATWTTSSTNGTGYNVASRVYHANATAPVIEGQQDILVGAGLTSAAEALVRPGHIQGDAFAGGHLQVLARYEFIDTNAATDSGYFILNGVAQASGQVINVSAS